MRRSQSFPEPDAGFSMELDADDVLVTNMLVSPPGSRTTPVVLWSRQFDTIGDRHAFLESIHSNAIDLTFLGHLTMIFGGAEMDKIANNIVTEARDARRVAAEKAADKLREHQIVNLFTRATKRGYVLELQRKSRDTADWKTVYGRASERDRLCDWLRWQQPRFLEFLDHAASHGDEALTRRVTDEMFEAERRVKKEGRGAGGVRPLRMWRGD